MYTIWDVLLAFAGGIVVCGAVWFLDVKDYYNINFPWTKDPNQDDGHLPPKNHD